MIIMMALHKARRVYISFSYGVESLKKHYSSIIELLLNIFLSITDILINYITRGFFLLNMLFKLLFS
jgi:hypothetical protein